jgi:hypothetical protein
LLVKGDYPAELDIPLPFSLLNNNTADNQLEIIPAFWWLYNMYALARNTWKFEARDKRKTKVQNIEFDSLAPDTVEEIFGARRLLEIWVGKASLRRDGSLIEGRHNEELVQMGRQLLTGSPESIAGLQVLGENMEKSGRNVVILKAVNGYHAYGQMLHYYAVKNLLEYMEANPEATLSSMCQELSGHRERQWVNLGGQLIPSTDVDRLRSDIGSGELDTWKDIHERYDALWQGYPRAKQCHAFATLCDLLGTNTIETQQWRSALEKAVEIQEYIRDQVYISRQKDFDNPFRQATYRNLDEMTAAIGTIEDNSFVKQVRQETEDFKKRVEQMKERHSSWKETRIHS